jgi:hypothetical protein
MALNRLQKALINSHIGPRTSGLNSQNIFCQMRTHTFFNTSDRDFFILKRTVYHKFTLTYPETKEKLKNATIVDA